MEGFEDVEPLPIVSGLPDELCEIMYTEEYKELVGVARALMEKKEMSKRALELTTKVIDVAPAFYTLWNYRFDILMFLVHGMTTDQKAQRLNEELDWVDEFTLNNPKNYQLWSYKQTILASHPAPVFKRELPVLKFMIDDDTKNYHVWSFRKWDVYNNSAWTHRMFVFKNLKPDHKQVKTELEYVMDKIAIVPQNISVWTYLRGFYENFLGNTYDERIVKFARKFTNNVTDLNLEDSRTPLPEIQSSYALEFLAHVYSRSKATMREAKAAYTGLCRKYDPIRQSYWDMQISKLT